MIFLLFACTKEIPMSPALSCETATIMLGLDPSRVQQCISFKSLPGIWQIQTPEGVQRLVAPEGTPLRSLSAYLKAVHAQSLPTPETWEVAALLSIFQAFPEGFDGSSLTNAGPTPEETPTVSGHPLMVVLYRYTLPANPPDPNRKTWFRATLAPTTSGYEWTLEAKAPGGSWMFRWSRSLEE